MKSWILVALLAVLTGCGSILPVPVAESQAPKRIEPDTSARGARPDAPTGKFHVVKKGDTLYSIALDHGIEYRELAAWNNIDNPSRIRIGQQLRVSPLVAEAAAVPASGAEIRPIASGGPVRARPLDGAVQPQAPAFTPGNSETLKRAPKGGKLPYSEENLALLKSREAGVATAPAAVQDASPPPVEKPASQPAPAAPTVAATAGEIDWVWPAPGKLIGTFSEGGNGAEASKGIDIAGKLGEPVQAAAAGKVIHVGSEIRGLGNFVVVKHSQEFLSVYGNTKRILVKQDQMVTRGQKIAELGDTDADKPKLHFEVRQQGKPVDPLKYLPAR